MKDKRIDSYIASAPPFAQPVLIHIRNLIHKACPSVTETIKWGMPNFVYQDSSFCFMAAFKAHCSFGFFKGSLMADPNKVFTKVGKSMGQFGKITQIKDLPTNAILVKYIKEAISLNEKGVKKPKKKVDEKKEIKLPVDFKSALNKNKIALKTFNGFSYTNKKDYIEWILDAKTELTRSKRIQTSLEWLEEGKPRNWKYLKK